MLVADCVFSAAPYRTIAAVPCGNSGNFNGDFCCSLEQSTSCCNASFGNIFGKPFAPVTLAATTTNDTNSTSTTAVTTVTAKPTGYPSSDATKVGVGVGVPLGLLLMLSLLFAAWTERRRRRDMERVARETGWTGGQWGHEKAPAGSYAHGIKGVRRIEVDGDGRLPELGDGQVHEAGGLR